MNGCVVDRSRRSAFSRPNGAQPGRSSLKLASIVAEVTVNIVVNPDMAKMEEDLVLVADLQEKLICLLRVDSAIEKSECGMWCAKRTPSDAIDVVSKHYADPKCSEARPR